MAFLLKYENIAWYDNGVVRVLDRRKYPLEVTYVECRRHEESAQAITDMVTQSGGPYLLCGMAMAQAADEAVKEKGEERIAYLLRAAETLYSSRPTTRLRMKEITDRCLKVAEEALEGGGDPAKAIFKNTVEWINNKYAQYDTIARYLVDLFPRSGKIMTQCFGETIVGCMLREAKKRNYDIKVFVPETRPYLQGARLTASVCYDMGFDTTLITDNMPAFVMEREGIDLFTSAADAICLDGHICNKVGTFQIALAAHYHGIPYFVTGKPDAGHPDRASVTIEMRNPEFALQCAGTRVVREGVNGYYPAFDITPPHLVSGVVTDKGIFSSRDVHRYFCGE